MATTALLDGTGSTDPDGDADGACADLLTEGLDCDDADPTVFPGAP